MVAVRIPAMRNFDELIHAMETGGSTFAAADIMKRAREVLLNWKKQHEEIRELIDPLRLENEKPIATLVTDKWAMLEGRSTTRKINELLAELKAEKEARAAVTAGEGTK